MWDMFLLTGPLCVGWMIFRDGMGEPMDAGLWARTKYIVIGVWLGAEGATDDDDDAW